MKINRNIILLAAGAVILVAFIASLILLVVEIQKFKHAEKELARSLKRLKEIHQTANPFPSQENVAIERDNAEKMQSWITTLVELLSRRQAEPDMKRSPSNFMNLFGERRNAMMLSAKKAGTKISDDFAFGFDKYAKSGALPVAEDVPRLTQQLTILENICEILFDEKIKELSRINREGFDGATFTADSPVSSGRAPRRRGGGVAVESRETEGRVASLPWEYMSKKTGEFIDDSTHAKLRFMIEFTAKEASIINILNRLSEDKMFIVVTSIDIEAEEAEFEKDTAVKTSPKAATGVVKAADAVPSKHQAPSRRERLVFGEELEKPALVKMQVDIYRFRQPGKIE